MMLRVLITAICLALYYGGAIIVRRTLGHEPSAIYWMVGLAWWIWRATGQVKP